MIAILLVVAGIALFGILIYSYFQMVALIINVVVVNGIVDWEWFGLNNFWAWVVTVIALAIVLGLIRVIFWSIRFVIALIGTGIGYLFGRHDGAVVGAVTLNIVTYLFAIAFAIVSVMVLINYTSANPYLTEYFVEGNWFAYIYIFALIMGSLYPNKSSDSKVS